MGADEAGIHRLARGAGFQARVAPISAAGTSVGWLARLRERRRLRRIADAVNAQLRAAGVDPGDWDRSGGEPVLRLRVEKLGVLEDLRTFARARPALALPHLLEHRERNALYVPADFDPPFAVDFDGDRIPVGSVPRLKRELARVESELNLETALAAGAAVDLSHASETDISKYESLATADPLFWPRFGFLLVRRLARAADEHRYPIIFS